MADIDIGPGATDRAGYVSGSGYTDIDLANPANGAGVLDTIHLFPNFQLSNCKVGTFYLISGETYKCRDSCALGTVTAGSEQVYTVDKDSNPISLDAEMGDLLGIYYTAGRMERDTEGGSGIMYYNGEAIDPGDQADFTMLAGDTISIYATGTVSGGWPNIAKVDGILAANIAKVDGIAAGDIAKICGVAV